MRSSLAGSISPWAPSWPWPVTSVLPMADYGVGLGFSPAYRSGGAGLCAAIVGYFIA